MDPEARAKAALLTSIAQVQLELEPIKDNLDPESVNYAMALIAREIELREGG